MKSILIGVVVVGSFMAALPAGAANRYVSAASGSPASPYTNWTTAATRIQDALDVSVAGDTIWVTNGTYSSTIPGANGAMLNLTNAVTVRSLNGAGATILDGGYPDVNNRCVYIGNASAILDGFTLRNGYATGGSLANHGGGCFLAAAGTVRNCLVVGNSADGNGGGIYINSNGSVINCTISSNTALGVSGGLYAATNGTIQNSILYFNTGASDANYHTNAPVTFSYTCSTPVPAGTANTASDPLFANLAALDCHIATNSPCKDAGLFQTWMTGAKDLDGQARVMGQVDLGVDEATRYFYVAKHGTNTNDGTQANPWGTIQYAVTNAAIAADDTILIGEGTFTESVTFPSPGSKNGLTLKGGYNTNDWTWAPAAHPTVIKSVNTSTDVIYFRSQGHTIMGVTLTGGRYGAYADNGIDTRYTFSHCTISNNVQDGIRVWANPVDFLIKNCLIVKNGGYGIFYTQDGGSSYTKEVYNCTIADNSLAGIYDNYQYGRGLTCYNNIIANNGNGISRQGGNPFTVANCDVYGSMNDNFGRVDAPGITFGAGNMSAFPAFVGAGDYHLQNGSPCVAYGQDLTASAITDDRDGNPRYAPYDMGCYQSSYGAAARSAATYADASMPDESGDGQSPATAKKVIGTAVAFTAPGGTCWVAAGTYHESFFIPANVTVSGTNRASTIITSAWHTVTMLETNATLRGVTVGNGIRGVDIANDNATVQNCVLRTNTYGLVQNRPGTKVYECIITNNTTYGIYGPGITGAGGVGMTVRNCLIARNGNSGVYLGWDNGGANWSQWLNCTVVSNGLHGYQARVYNSQAYITNSIFAGNAGYGTYVSTWGSAKQYLNYSCEFGNVSGANYADNGQTPQLGGNMVNSDPTLDNTYHLLLGSPCVDAGINIASITNDLDGTARASTNIFDIGCYESSFAPPPHYDAVYVDASMVNDTGAGTNWTTAKKTIGAAITLLTSTGTVYAASGLYGEAVSIPANNTVAGTDWTSTIISNSGNVITLSATNSRLRDVTVVGGTYGIAMSGAGNFATHCIVRNNASHGVYMTAASNRLDQCIVRNNNQCGIYVVTPVSCNYTVDRCTIASNTSHGIYQQGGSGSSPAGIILDSLIVNNGGDGFSTWTDNSTLGTRIYNCTFANNIGNGIYDNYLTTAVDIRNCIVYGNATSGIRQLNNGHSGGFNVTSSCVFSNAQGNLSYTLANGTMKLLTGCMTANPLFVGGNDYHLQANSPCLGYGTTNSVLGVAVNDLDGVARSAPFDMGCYESASSPVTRTLTQYVNGASGNDAADGTTPGTAKLTIGSGLALTAPSGTCYVAAGTYRDTVILPAMVALEGADPATTIITSAWHVAYMPESNSVVRKVTLQNGYYGVYQSGKYDTLDQCVLRYNSIGYYLDGAYQQGWNALINRTVAISNTSHGAYVLQAGVTAVNSLFARNGGDGLLINSDNPQTYSHMNFCTFADNASSGYEDNNGTHFATTLTNCIVSGNAVNGIRFVRTFNDQISYSCVYGNAGGDFSSFSLTIGAGMITNQWPVFHVDPLGNNYALAWNSPCLDCGTNINITNDLVGVLRPLIGRKPLVGSGYDMGAYEYVRPPNGSIFEVQ